MQLDDSSIVAYFVRHGQTILNAKDAFRGPIDAPLDSVGLRDAHIVARLMEPIEVSYIFHSDKKRTRATAETIGSLKPNVEIFPNANLSAWNVGYLGGQEKSEENNLIVEYHVNHPDIPIPEGESLNEFRNRVVPLLEDAIEMGFHSGVPPLLVVHSSVIHELGNLLGGSHEYTLVEPGGVAVAFIQDGRVDAEPIFKPRPRTVARRAEIMT